jgi:cytochrome c553
MVTRGREIFEGKGLCFTCHTRGDGPTTPAFPDLQGIGKRAGERIEGMDSLAYFSHSLYEPNAFIVPGYRAGMLAVTQPPIGLSDQEVGTVIAYLQSLGAEPTVTASTVLPVVLSAEQLAAVTAAAEANSQQEAGEVRVANMKPPVAIPAQSAEGMGSLADTELSVSTVSSEEVRDDSAPAIHADQRSSTARGQMLFARTCAICHGASAEGNVVFNAPRLAGQESWYVARQLKNFAEGIRGSDPRDVFGLQMRPMAMTLQGEQEITDIAAYLASIE